MRARKRRGGLGSSKATHMRRAASAEKQAREYLRSAVGYAREGNCKLAINRMGLARTEVAEALAERKGAGTVNRSFGNLFNRVQRVGRMIESRCVR